MRKAALVLIFALAEAAAAPVPPALEDTLFDELSLLRTNPRALVPRLEAMRRHFQGDLLQMPGEVALLTREGVRAVDEAIAFLREAEPLPPFRRARGMSRAAAGHAAELGRTGSLDHASGDGSSPGERMNHHGRWLGACAENLSFGHADAARVVLQLVIDDGVPDRGHRKNLMNPRYAVVGLACGPHPRYRHLCVIDFAADYEEADGRSGAQRPRRPTQEAR